MVDDEVHIREMLLRGLSRAGYECAAARNTDVAAELLQRDKFDLALLDIMMPGKSGVDFLEDIKAQQPDMAVIMLTGMPDIFMAVRAMKGGADDYAAKPVSIGELIIRVENALSRRALLLGKREYQRKLEQFVDELNTHNEQLKRELAALSSLLLSQTGLGGTAEATYTALQAALTTFGSEIESLFEFARMISPGDADAGTP